MDFALRTVVIISSIDKEVTKCEPSQFIGKVSPQFFWGSFDLAVSRFSGRPAPMHPGAPYVARSVMIEAYSHEVSSCGFWPGGEAVNEPAFYAYSYPEPPGFKQYPI